MGSLQTLKKITWKRMRNGKNERRTSNKTVGMLESNIQNYRGVLHDTDPSSITWNKNNAFDQFENSSTTQSKLLLNLLKNQIKDNSSFKFLETNNSCKCRNRISKVVYNIMREYITNAYFLIHLF